MAEIPITIALSGISFEDATAALAGEAGFFCIDARGAHPSSGRCSIVSALPRRSFSMAGGFITMDGHTTIETPYTAFNRFCASVSEMAFDPYLPFSGGIAGYIGFEGARALAGLDPARGFSRHSQCRLGLYPAAAIFDHSEGTAMLVASGHSSNEARENADRLMERIEAGMGRTGRREAKADLRHGMCSIPGDRAFAETLAHAKSWLRAGSAKYLHVVRHGLRPFATDDLVGHFLEGGAPETLRAIFTHEGAAYLTTSWDALIRSCARSIRSTLAFSPSCDAARPMQNSVARQVEAKLTRLCSDDGPPLARVAVAGSETRRISFDGVLSHELAPIDALIGLLPSHSATGTPHDRALDFIDRNEAMHRSLYGGAFGTMDAHKLSFSTIQGVETAADGTLGTTVGMNLTADLDERDVMSRFDELFSLSLPQTG